MGKTSVVRAGWRRFRGLAGWMQLVIALVAGLLVVSPFTSEGDRQTVAATAPPAAPAPAITVTTLAPGVPAPGDDTAVVRVIDGDTIEVTGGTRVRLIGVDTPETADCFSAEATRYANELLPPGTRIRLVYDLQRLDVFGRTLAYVYKLGDGVFVNLAAARNGFAQQLTVPPNVAHAEEFRVAVASARTADLGLWHACLAPLRSTIPVLVPGPGVATPTTRAAVARPVTTTTVAPAAAGCHPSYVGACVPIGFSDVDCAGGGGNGPGYVSDKRFQVVGPDVYGLDGNDNDGIACES